MTAPAYSTSSRNRPSTSNREGRDWRITLDFDQKPIEVFGRLKIEDPVGWVMVIDADDDGANFVALAAPSKEVILVECLEDSAA